MVFTLIVGGKPIFRGNAVPGFSWPNGAGWLPVEVRTADGWFKIGVVVCGRTNVLVCPD